MNLSRALVALIASAFIAFTSDVVAETTNALKWIDFPNANLEVYGLPWLKENSPELWRFPKSAKDIIPKRVWERAVAPDGGRMRFSSDTTRLTIRVEAKGGERKRCFFDAYIDNQYAGSGELKSGGQSELPLFESKPAGQKQITVYFPNNNEVRLLAVGVDENAKIKPSAAFKLSKPIVCYGSSVCQGTGATHPSKTYPAIAARTMGCDFVNLGFGGAGKAEPEVVSLVNQLDACCYLFDLGKSYGDQGIEPFAKMLETIRRSHPQVPIIVVTPIYAVKEATEPDYVEKSERLRKLMRQAAKDLQAKGEKNIYVAEGLELFGAADKDYFHDPLHPSDEGNERLASRLVPLLNKALTPAQR